MSKTLLAFFGIGAGGVAPLAYMVTQGLGTNSSSSGKTLGKLISRKDWECQIKEFDATDLKRVFYNAPFFKKLHCFKELEYDWKIFLPSSLFEPNKLDEKKALNLISEQREHNISPIKIIQESKELFKDWLLLRNIKSYNITGGELSEEKLKYLGLYEFEIINSELKDKRAWVIL